MDEILENYNNPGNQKDQRRVDENGVPITPHYGREEKKSYRNLAYDDVMKDVPIDVLFMYIEEKAEELSQFNRQETIFSRKLAKLMKDVGFYAESTHVENIAMMLESESMELMMNRGKLESFMAMQLVSLNVLYQYTMEKFIRQQVACAAGETCESADATGNIPKMVDTRMLHYALLAQSQCISTTQIIRDTGRLRSNYGVATDWVR